MSSDQSKPSRWPHGPSFANHGLNRRNVVKFVNKFGSTDAAGRGKKSPVLADSSTAMKKQQRLAFTVNFVIHADFRSTRWSARRNDY
jgi:hypothetical protein